MYSAIDELIGKEIRPWVQSDGGEIELVGVDGGTVRIRIKGKCGSCPASKFTLEHLVETMLKEKVPGIREVRFVEQNISDDLIREALRILRKGPVLEHEADRR
ncbi:MAG: NifU family protein [Firmicutes bacterium]|nr:NifU family protein [Bacillota bacterium]